MAASQATGMSRSVRGAAPFLSAPVRRTAVREARTPSAMGPSRLSSVQTAAMPIAPAPTKRTWWPQTSVANLAMSAPGGMAATAVSSGTATPQAITTPVSIAIPAMMPTR